MAAANTVKTRQHDGPYNQLLLFGDSITQHSFATQGGTFSYGAALSYAYVRKLDVINRGFSGYNTSHALRLLPKIIPSPSQAKIELLIIFFGANDSVLPEDPGKQYVPLETFQQNLKAIINSPQVQSHNPRILLITPPPVDERQQIEVNRARDDNQGDSVYRIAGNTGRYAQACKEVGDELNLPVVDIWTRMLQYAGWEGGDDLPGALQVEQNAKLQSLFIDGLHLTCAGYELLCEAVLEAIKTHHPQLHPDAMELCHPVWQEAPI